MTDSRPDTLSPSHPDDSPNPRPLSHFLILGGGQGEGDAEDLPEGWAMAPLGEVCLLNPPKPPADALAADAPVSFVPMPAVDDKRGAITAPSERPFSEVRKGYTAFRDDDVIFAKITPCMENGKAAVARGLVNGLGFGSTEFHVLRSIGATIPDYIYHFVRQEFFRKEAEAEMTGSVGQKRVPAEFLRAYEIPLPPLAEQKRIVAKVEELLARINAARDRLAKVPAILKRFRQSVLSAACSGKLTEDWRSEKAIDGQARVLLEQILDSRRHLPGCSRSPCDPAPGFDEEIPESWVVASMDQLTSRITSGSRDWKRYYRENGSGTFIMAQNIRPLKFDRSFRLAIDPPEGNRDRKRSEVSKDDLLVTIVGANTGDVCRVHEHVTEHYVCQSVALLRPVFPDLARYIELFLNSPEHGQLQFQRWIYGEGRPHLSFDQLRETAVSLPGFEEQHEIVRRVEALFSLADAIEKRVAQATQRVEKTTQAILAKAFRGELVPTEAELARRDSRPYELASTLLARVKQVRTAKSGHALTRRKLRRGENRAAENKHSQ